MTVIRRRRSTGGGASSTPTIPAATWAPSWKAGRRTTLAPDSSAREMVESYAEVAWSFYRRLKADDTLMAGDPRLAEMYERATAYMNDIPEPAPVGRGDMIISPRLKKPDGRVIPTATMIARFGSAREVRIGELQVELMFPLDAQGEAFFAQLAHGRDAG
jgi:hypothetical protein